MMTKRVSSGSAAIRWTRRNPKLVAVLDAFNAIDAELKSSRPRSTTGRQRAEKAERALAELRSTPPRHEKRMTMAKARQNMRKRYKALMKEAGVAMPGESSRLVREADRLAERAKIAKARNKASEPPNKSVGGGESDLKKLRRLRRATIPIERAR